MTSRVICHFQKSVIPEYIFFGENIRTSYCKLTLGVLHVCCMYNLKASNQCLTTSKMLPPGLRLNVVGNRWVSSSASLCVKRRKLTVGESEKLAYWRFRSCFAALLLNTDVSGKSPQIFRPSLPAEYVTARSG